jgi:hypothetical protein
VIRLLTRVGQACSRKAAAGRMSGGSQAKDALAGDPALAAIASCSRLECFNYTVAAQAGAAPNETRFWLLPLFRLTVQETL